MFCLHVNQKVAAGSLLSILVVWPVDTLYPRTAPLYEGYHGAKRRLDRHLLAQLGLIH
jgi:hypothetical protein